MTNDEIKVRECETVAELDACVRLQREVFALPDLEISPRRHLIVTKSAGGFTLGAFTAENRLIGFVLSVPMFRPNGERAFYSQALCRRECCSGDENVRKHELESQGEWVCDFERPFSSSFGSGLAAVVKFMPTSVRSV